MSIDMINRPAEIKRKLYAQVEA